MSEKITISILDINPRKIRAIKEMLTEAQWLVIVEEELYLSAELKCSNVKALIESYVYINNLKDKTLNAKSGSVEIYTGKASEPHENILKYLKCLFKINKCDLAGARGTLSCDNAKLDFECGFEGTFRLSPEELEI